MNWKDLLPLNWSRKAQIVVVAIAGIGYIAGLPELDAAVAIRGMCLMAGVGALGVVCQAVIDWKHPQKNSNQPTPTVVAYTAEPVAAGISNSTAANNDTDPNT